MFVPLVFCCIVFDFIFWFTTNARIDWDCSSICSIVHIILFHKWEALSFFTLINLLHSDLDLK